MSSILEAVAKRAVSTEIVLQRRYRRLQRQVRSPRLQPMLRDLLLMAEMNEVLWRSLKRNS